MAPDAAGGGSDERWGASYGVQLSVLFTRTIKTRRFEALGTQDVIQFVVRGLLCGQSGASLARACCTAA